MTPSGSGCGHNYRRFRLSNFAQTLPDART
jgi:hypothetical protein